MLIPRLIEEEGRAGDKIVQHASESMVNPFIHPRLTSIYSVIIYTYIPSNYAEVYALAIFPKAHAMRYET